MKKNTILAIVLSTIVVFTSMFIQHKFFPVQEEKDDDKGKSEEIAKKENTTSQDSYDYSEGFSRSFKVINTDDSEDLKEKKYTIETPLVTAVFTNKGGDILSYKLKNYKETSGEDGVEMIKNSTTKDRAFSLSLNSVNAPSFDGLCKVKMHSTEDSQAIAFIVNVKDIEKKDDKKVKKDKIVENDKISSTSNNESNKNDGEITSVDSDAKEGEDRIADYRIIKEYRFFNNDYMFLLTITVEAVADGEVKNIEKFFYSLKTPSQIGPDWVGGDRYEYRKFYSYSNDSMKDVKVSEGEEKTDSDVSQWVAVAGKYFALAVIPENAIKNTTYSMKKRDDAPLHDSQIFIRAPLGEGNKRKDVYRVYIGPNSDKFLTAYNVPLNNAHGLSDVQVNRIAASGGLLWPLEMLLKFFLENINRLVRNWGVSILIMTLIMRLIFFPLTKKSSKATRKMQEMQPKIKGLQDKYKGNPQRLNTEMTRLYQEAGYSPLSGCLPMLIQIPFLFAMFALFNNYFEFRGASFIPGWIPDLSTGDSVWKFGQTLPVLGWTDLRLLPIIYVASQLVFGKVTQAGPQDNSNPTMRFMVYFMPLFFFFIFYNAPSGLLLFWTASNILMLAQQIVINKTLDKEEKKRKKKS